MNFNISLVLRRRGARRRPALQFMTFNMALSRLFIVLFLQEPIGSKWDEASWAEGARQAIHYPCNFRFWGSNTDSQKSGGKRKRNRMEISDNKRFFRRQLISCIVRLTSGAPRCIRCITLVHLMQSMQRISLE